MEAELTEVRIVLHLGLWKIILIQLQVRHCSENILHLENLDELEQPYFVKEAEVADLTSSHY